MNLPYPLSPFYPPTTPSNYYSCPYIQSPYNTAIQTSLNSSSGYESASHETSFVDPCFSTPSTVMKVSGEIVLFILAIVDYMFRNHILILFINNRTILIRRMIR
jgi:hypothetical protein